MGSRFVMRVIKGLIIVIVVGAVAGVITIATIMLAMLVALKMVGPLPVEADAVGSSVVINHCDTSGMIVLTDSRCDISPQTSLEVVYNYGEQKTAPIHVLEPKVSDVYLQYAPMVNELEGALYFDTTTNEVVRYSGMQSLVKAMSLAKEAF
jgi:hypothetical protein